MNKKNTKKYKMVIEKILKFCFEKDILLQLWEIEYKDYFYEFILENKKEIIKELKKFGEENQLDVKKALSNLKNITKQNQKKSNEIFDLKNENRK